MIQVRDLKKVFRFKEGYTVALGGINLDVDQGEFVAIMGPSGCGKTTLLNILGLLDNPSEGNYLLAGMEVANLNESQRTALRKGRIGFIFQSFNLIDELTVEQNVELPLMYNKEYNSRQRREAAVKALQAVGLGDRLEHKSNEMSGGQMPELILADEPTGNLDSKNGKEVMELLASLNDDGTTIIMVTHSQRDAAYAHRIVNMLDGFLVEKTEL